MKIFERTYLDGLPRENSLQFEKNPTIEKPDLPKKCCCSFDKEAKMPIQEICQQKIEVIDETSPPKAPKRKPKKASSKSHKAAAKKI